jgi:hypothetical protein
MKRLVVFVIVFLFISLSALHALSGHRFDSTSADDQWRSAESPVVAVSFFPSTRSMQPVESLNGYRPVNSPVDHSWFFFLGFVAIGILLWDDINNNDKIPPSGF